MRLGKSALTRAAAAGLALSAIALFSCRKNPTVSFEVDVPSGLADQAVWVEVGAYPGTTCSSLGPQAAAGLPQGYASRIAFRLSDPARPSMGDLPRKSYAFVGTLRDQNCGVIGIGCVTADVGSSGNVVVSLQATGQNPAPGTCASDAACQEAVCISSSDGTNPTIGSGCTLQMIGAGPLGGRILDGDTLADENIGAPAVTATSTGFLIAYREMATQLGRARVRTLAIDPGGGTKGATGKDIPRCTGDDEKDGLGLALAGDVGLLGFSRHQCMGGTAGVDYIALDSNGSVGGYAAVFDMSNPDRTVEFSYGKTIAPSPTKGLYNVAYLQNGDAIFAQTQLGALAVKPSENTTRKKLFETAGPYTEAHVASSDKVLAFLSRSASAAPPPEEGGVSEGGSSGSAATLHLQVVAANTTPITFGSQAATDIPAIWGAIAASSNQVAVLTPGVEQPLMLRVYNQTRTLLAQAEIVTISPDPYISGDIAFVDGRVLIAAARPGSISLLAFTHGGDAGGLLPEVLLEQDPRVPDLRAYRDGHVAIAATSTRALIAWTTATSLTGSDPTGGYALFACAK
jgi:hypothetical protein